jgi:hypothetical protein
MPDILVVGMQGPLFFADADNFRNAVTQHVNSDHPLTRSWSNSARPVRGNESTGQRGGDAAACSGHAATSSAPRSTTRIPTYTTSRNPRTAPSGP